MKKTMFVLIIALMLLSTAVLTACESTGGSESGCGSCCDGCCNENKEDQQAAGTQAAQPQPARTNTT